MKAVRLVAPVHSDKLSVPIHSRASRAHLFVLMTNTKSSSLIKRRVYLDLEQKKLGDCWNWSLCINGRPGHTRAFVVTWKRNTIRGKW